MEVANQKYSITKFSHDLQITVHALRYYEKEFGLIVPKDERGRRYYTDELVQLLQKIKLMRDEGIEIKTIKKRLQEESALKESHALVINESSSSPVTLSYQDNSESVMHFFHTLQENITQNIVLESAATRDFLEKEIYKSKLEIGACVENSSRRLEAKMERHFNAVDQALTNWRKGNKKVSPKSFFHKFLG